MKKFLNRMLCMLVGHHQWTCAHEQGISPTEDQLKSAQGFFDYAKMYCSCCGKKSGLNVDLAKEKV